MTVKMADKKGRVSLPKGFADQHVIVELIDETEVRIRKATVIPAKEAWLWKNPVALSAVMRGIEEAKAGMKGVAPDLGDDADDDEDE